MTEEEAFSRFHTALDVEPPPGAWDRLHVALAEQQVRELAPRRPGRSGWRPALQPLLGVAAALLIVAVAAAALTWHAISVSPAQGGAAAAPGRPVAVYSVNFVDSTTGWVAASGAPGSDTALYFTKDGGVHWARQALLGRDAVVTSGHAFDDRNLVFMAWDGQNQPPRPRLAWTEDGGSHFHFSDLPGSSYQASSFLSPKQGWVYASSVVYATADGGATWHPVSNTDPAHGLDRPEDGTSYWLHFTDATTGFLGTNVQSGLPRIHVTHDGGHTWAPVSIAYPPGLDPAGGRAGIGAPPGFTDSRDGTLPFYYLPNQGSGPVAGRIWVLSTNDGGWQWSLAGEVPAPSHWNGPAVPPPLGWNGQVTTGSVAWTSREWQLGFEQRLLLTTNAGRTWSSRTLPLPRGYFISALRLQQDHGWVLATDPSFLFGTPRHDILLRVDGPRVAQIRLPSP